MSSSRTAQRKKGKARVIRWTPARKAAFLLLLAEGYSIGEAAKAQGLSRRSAYDLKQKDEEFAEAWDDAREEFTELLEREVWARAIGKPRTVMDKKGNVHEIEVASDILLMFALKARKPEYRDSMNVSVEHRRKITVNLLPVVKDEKSGQLRLADDVDAESVEVLGEGT